MATIAVGPTVRAQTSHEHEVEKLTVSDVGTYRSTESADLERAREGIVTTTEAFRKAEGRDGTSLNDSLHAAAQAFAEFMATHDLYGHTADDRNPSDRAKEQGYEFCIIEENIAYAFRSTGFDADGLSRKFVEGWKNSPPHWKNMLNPDVTETGVGLAQSPETGVYYAVQMFGRPRSMMIEFQVSNATGEDAHYRLGQKTFALPARVIRTHQLCRPSGLQLLASDTDDAAVLEDVSPASGEEWTVETVSDGQQTLTRTSSANRKSGTSGSNRPD